MYERKEAVKGSRQRGRRRESDGVRLGEFESLRLTLFKHSRARKRSEGTKGRRRELLTHTALLTDVHRSIRRSTLGFLRHPSAFPLLSPLRFPSGETYKALRREFLGSLSSRPVECESPTGRNGTRSRATRLQLMQHYAIVSPSRNRGRRVTVK